MTSQQQIWLCLTQQRLVFPSPICKFCFFFSLPYNLRKYGYFSSTQEGAASVYTLVDGSVGDWFGGFLYSAGQQANEAVQDQLSSLSFTRWKLLFKRLVREIAQDFKRAAILVLAPAHVRFGHLSCQILLLGLKSHVVTLYEAGKLGHTSIVDLCKDLSTLEGTKFEGELQEFANHAFTLMCSRMFDIRWSCY
ncbi:hypothetical protein ACSBR1_005243 [Camellia fascicularis]